LLFTPYYSWFNFVPVIGGMLIHELYEQAETNHELRHAIAEPNSGGVRPPAKRKRAS
jgi:hypothetical protein